jgi:enamine deaminase RidA (YjgF/YER057c/UK114 family)
MRTTVTKRILPASIFCIALLACASSTVRPQKQQSAERGNPMSMQNHKFRLFNPDTMAKPVAGYSQVAEVTGGKLVYIAGQVALDTSGTLVGKDDFPAQVEQVFKNLKAAVEAAGGDFNDVIKLNFYCAESVDPALIPQVRGIRDKYVNTQNPPTSTFVVVDRLVRPEWLIEVEATAVVRQ